MRIGPVTTEEQVLVVAEIGNNHEGSARVALELVRAAAAARADAVKLQTFRVESYVRPGDRRRRTQMARFELSPAETASIADLAHELGMLFISTPLDLPSVQLLEPLVDAYKVASADNDFLPLLERVAEAGRPVIVSAGLVDTDGIRATVDAIEAASRRAGVDEELAVLHAVTAYPASPEAANLAVIPALERQLGRCIGYSDHVLGIEASLAAVALGARIVEKHFTLAHDWSDFRDHALSADPAELAELVDRIRSGSLPVPTPLLAGSPIKTVQPAERRIERSVRRSIVAAQDLCRGEVVDLGALAWMRPRDGLPPGREGDLVGRVLRRDIGTGESVLPSDLV